MSMVTLLNYSMRPFYCNVLGRAKVVSVGGIEELLGAFEVWLAMVLKGDGG